MCTDFKTQVHVDMNRWCLYHSAALTDTLDQRQNVMSPPKLMEQNVRLAQEKYILVCSKDFLHLIWKICWISYLKTAQTWNYMM